MDSGFSILMFIFIMTQLIFCRRTRDYKMLPYRSRVSVKPKDPRAYTLQLAKVIALVSVAIAAGAAVALWNQPVGGIVMLAGVIAAIWAGTKIVKN